MKAVGANPAPRMAGKEALAGKVNYFLGNDPTKWHTNIPIYAKVEYKDVYPGIDVMYYSNRQTLEYDLIVSPGADPTVITYEFQGADKIEIDAHGDLVLYTAVGEIRQGKPFVYQEVAGVKQVIPAYYVLKGEHRVGFHVATYVASLPLIIDPFLNLGPGGDGEGNATALDASGNSYVAGWTQSSAFPATNGSSLNDVPGTCSFGTCPDAFAAKLAPDGSIIWATYLGSSASDFGYAVAVDTAGNSYVAGTTFANDFPTPNAFQPFGGGASDAFLTKLSPTGSLVYSTYVGGTGDVGSDLGDFCGFGGALAADAGGNAYMTGGTDSTDLATTQDAANPAYSGDLTDTFVVKVGPLGQKLYLSYLGTAGIDFGNGVTVDGSGNIYVASETSTSPSNVVITKLSPAGVADPPIIVGGSDDDFGPSIAVDGSGNIYLTGSTISSDFPTANALQPLPGGGFDAFVTKLDATGSVLNSTYLGGSIDEIATAIAVNTSGDVFVAGVTFSADFPTVNPQQSPFTGEGDVYVVELTATTPTNPTPTLASSTSAGVTDTDLVVGIALDPGGSVFVGGGATQVTIKITPRSINLGKKEKIKVEILSSLAFDAPAQVDQASLTFGHSGLEASPVKECHTSGKKVTCEFLTEEAGFVTGDTQGTLKGLTIAGNGIIGTDSIRLVPSKK